MKPVVFNNIEFKEIVTQVKELVKESESLPDPAHDLTTKLLKFFDLMHREPLARILRTIEETDPALMEKLQQDYTISTLMELYDFKTKKA